MRYRGCLKGWVRDVYYPHRAVYGFMPSRGIMFRGRLARHRRTHHEYSDSERIDFRATEVLCSTSPLYKGLNWFQVIHLQSQLQEQKNALHKHFWMLNNQLCWLEYSIFIFILLV